MVLKPGKEAEAEAIFQKWGLDFAVVGRTTDTCASSCAIKGEVMADLPIKELGDEAPVYDRPWAEPKKRARLDRRVRCPAPVTIAEALDKLIASPDLCSRRWVWEQYDHLILGNTVQRPGGDAAVVRVGDGPKALALTTDVTPRYCEADPFEGGKQAVAEAGAISPRSAREPLAHHRQSQFRQSRAARDHGPVRRLRARHRRSLPRARLPGRVGQRLALQRDQRPRDPADADHRRRRPARRLREDARRWPSRPRARRSCSSARPRAGSASRAILRDDPRPRGRRAAAGRSRRREDATAISCAR